MLGGWGAAVGGQHGVMGPSWGHHGAMGIRGRCCGDMGPLWGHAAVVGTWSRYGVTGLLWGHGAVVGCPPTRRHQCPQFPFQGLCPAVHLALLALQLRQLRRHHLRGVPQPLRPQRDPKVSPKRPQRDPKVSPKGAQWDPMVSLKGPQCQPKGTPKGTQWELKVTPKCPQRDPSGTPK